MKVRMLETRLGSPDGIQVNEYKAGEKYDMPESLAKGFLKNGWAEEDRTLDVPEETKKSEDKPKNRPKRRANHP